jgi:hypothetical protein
LYIKKQEKIIKTQEMALPLPKRSPSSTKLNTKTPQRANDKFASIFLMFPWEGKNCCADRLLGEDREVLISRAGLVDSFENLLVTSEAMEIEET